MRKFLLFSFLILFSTYLFSQDKFTISGYIKDKSNGEALIGVTALIKELGGGAVSNVYGFYSITIPAGTYILECKYIGYKNSVQTIELNENISLNIELESDEVELNEVVVTERAKDQNVSSVEMSVATLNVESIKKLPSFAGEVDIIKSIQLLPGVSTVGEGASGFNVRGGSTGQNLVLLDEAPVYQTSHLFGFFSVFNPDAVKDVKLYKGGIDARYGGRLSSILDVRMKEGNSKKYEVTGGIGTVFSRLAIEGPIVKDKASFIIAGRRSYIDILAKPFLDSEFSDSKLYFYDLTLKTNYNINEKNRVYLSAYLGRDVFGIDDNQGFGWGNATTTLRWNHLFNEKFFSNFTAFYSNYDYGFQFGNGETSSFKWKSDIETLNFKSEFTYFFSPNFQMNFGGDVMYYFFNPANATALSDSVFSDFSLKKKRALESSIYFSIEHKLNEKITLQYGIRYSNFNFFALEKYTYNDTIPGFKKSVKEHEEYDDYKTINTFNLIEPRFSIKYQLNNTSSVKASYNRMSQYIHLISNTSASLPIDVWQPSSNNLPNQIGNQVALGYFKNFKNNEYEASIEAYYKWSENQIDYIDGADLLINPELEGELLPGIGRAYGLELFVKRNKGKLTGWVSYTLGKTETKIDGINFGSNVLSREGEWFPTRFDQRHNLKLVANYQITKNTELGFTFTYVSGTPATFPVDRINVQGYLLPLLANQRNTVRIPDFHRLDLAYTWNNVFFKKKEKYTDFLVIAVYNVYSRRNPFAIYFTQEINETTKNLDDGVTPINQITKAFQTSIIGFPIPSFSYNFKF